MLLFLLVLGLCWLMPVFRKSPSAHHGVEKMNSVSGNWISVFEVPCIIMMWCCKMGIEVCGVRTQHRRVGHED